MTQSFSGHHNAKELSRTLTKHSVRILCFSILIQKNHTPFTNGSHYVYSGVLTQAVKSPEDLRPISYTSDSFSDMQQRWSATREAFVVYYSVLKFDLYIRVENVYDIVIKK